MRTKLKAFLNDPKIKTKYLSRVCAHAKADEIVRGIYWEEDRGCAVGCTIHSSNHNAYETELGIPEWLARVEDQLFEGVSMEYAKTWPVSFLKSINTVANLEKIKGPFLIYVLTEVLSTIDNVKYADVTKSIKTVISLYKKKSKDIDAFRKAANASANASANAAYASAYAAYASANASANAAREQTYEKYAEKLIELLKACK